MKCREEDRRKADACIRILEGEVMLLRDTVAGAMNWQRPSEVRAAIVNIIDRAEQVAEAVGVELSPRRDD